MASWQRTLYAMWASQLLSMIGFSMRTPFLPLFIGDLGTTSVEQQAIWAGVINAAGPLVMAFSAPFWGMMSDRYGRKPMVLRSMFAGAAFIGLMALATSPWQLVGLRIFEGALTGTMIAATTLIATSIPKERLGFSLGLMQTGVFAGSAIGPLFGGIMADLIGYRATFGLAGSMLFIGGVLVVFFVQEHFERPAASGEGGKQDRAVVRALILAPAMFAMIMVVFMLRLVTSAIQPIVPLFVEQLSHTTSAINTLSGLSLGVMGLTSALAAIFLGRIGDRIGQRTILIVSALLAGLLYFPQAAAQSVTQLIIIQALFGVAVGGVVPTANAVIANLTPPERRGAIYGISGAIVSFGGFVGPISGALLAAAIDIRATFVMTGLMMLAAGFWVWRAVPQDLEAEDAREPVRT